MGTQITEQQLPPIARIGLSFSFQWLIANAAGFTIGMAVRQFAFGLGPWLLNSIIIGAIVGTSIGVVQMLNLQQYVNRPGWWWVLTNTFGWAIGWSLISQHLGYFVLGLGITEFSMIRGATTGLLVGLLQWVILQQLFHHAGWWVLASTFAWAAGMAIGVTVGKTFGWPLVGAVSGLITGFPLIWIMRQPRFRNQQ